MTKVVRDGTKTIVIPLMTPGTLRGRMILKKSAYYLHQDLLQHKVHRGQFCKYIVNWQDT